MALRKKQRRVVEKEQRLRSPSLVENCPKMAFHPLPTHEVNRNPASGPLSPGRCVGPRGPVVTSMWLAGIQSASWPSGLRSPIVGGSG